MHPKVQNSNFGSNQHFRLSTLAALFEGDFSIDWLLQLSKMKVSEILFVLEQGRKDGWLIQKEPGIFCFRDKKKQQQYKSHLSQKEKEKLHRQIADLLMKELLDDDNKVLSIAHHLSHIPNSEGTRWLLKAGDIYLVKHEIQKASQCYAKVIKDLSDLNGKEVDWLFTEAAIKYSKISTGELNTSKVLSILQEAMARSKKWNRQKCQAFLEMHIAKNKWMRSDYTDALKHFEKGWSMANNLQNPKLLRSATTFSTFFLYWQGRFKEVVYTLERSIPDVEKYPNGKFPLLATLTLGRSYAEVGQVNQGLGIIDSIFRHSLEAGNLNMAAYAGANTGAIMINIGAVENALQYLEYSLRDAKQGHNEWIRIVGTLMSAFANYLDGKNKRAISFLREFLQQSNHGQVLVRPYPYLLELCWAMEQKKFPHIAGLSLEKEIKGAITTKNVFLKGIAYRYQAFLQIREAVPYEKIMESLSLSQRYLEESGSQIEQAKTEIEISRQHLLIGNDDRAKEKVLIAYERVFPINKDLFPNDLRPLIKDSFFKTNLFDEIMKLSQKIVTIRDNKTLLQHILFIANQITGAERGAIFLVDKNKDPLTFRLRASRNLTSEEVADPGFETSMKLIEKVAKTGKASMEAGNTRKTCSLTLRKTIRSRIAVPMLLRDEVIGVLYHDNLLFTSAFRKSDLSLLAYFAAQAAFALDNAIAYEKQQQLNQKLQEEKCYYREQHIQDLHFADIVGESPPFKRVLAQVNDVASTDTTVLILGETGVGKELVARAIHDHNSRRCGKTFVPVNCGALTESLATSELFGYEKGAFTGANKTQVGRFELADGGTLFLDEIGNLHLDTQARLLRVLQNKDFQRVGGSKTLHSDFRLLAATNHELRLEVEANRFRADLYYRLNIFPIVIPPLRDRREDIPLLACYFLKIYAKKLGKSFEGIPKSEINKLIQYDWPGNVRELQNILERGAILSREGYFRLPEMGVNHSDLANPEDFITLKECERRHILLALQETGWKVRGKGGAAELLEIHPSTLRFRMNKLDIQRSKDMGVLS